MMRRAEALWESRLDPMGTPDSFSTIRGVGDSGFLLKFGDSLLEVAIDCITNTSSYTL